MAVGHNSQAEMCIDNLAWEGSSEKNDQLYFSPGQLLETYPTVQYEDNAQEAISNEMNYEIDEWITG